MRKHLIIIMLVLLCVGISCSEKSRPVSTNTTPVQTYQDLTCKDHVLNNLELAFNDGDITRYEDVLDDNFKFFFGAADFATGNFRRFWRDDEELAATVGLFTHPSVRSADLALSYPSDNWTPIAPGSMWYEKTVTYYILVDTEPDTQYFGENLKARIVIREVNVDGTNIWQICEWHDDVQKGRSGASIEETTWGAIKKLYYVPPYQDLTEKDHVLNNLELAFNEQDIQPYSEVLEDDKFTFFFGAADFAQGTVPEFWQYDAELQGVNGLFTNDAVRSIDLTLSYPTDNWTAFVPDVPEYPGELWYLKQVTYNILVDTRPDTQYLGDNLKAQFAIRLVNVDGKDIWQIREWYDDVQQGRSGGGTEDETWGQIKALYN